MPRVFEGQQLGIGLAAPLVVEDDVVVAVAVEGRVEVDQVDAGVGQVAAQDVEVVAGVVGRWSAARISVSEPASIPASRRYRLRPRPPEGCVSSSAVAANGWLSGR